MICYYPREVWKSRELPGISSDIIFRSHSESFYKRRYDPITLPCGQCIGCRLAYSRNWAVRCVHEASFHDANSFVTLTYNDNHLPLDGSLDLKHFQDFMKRLRKKFGFPIRYFHCGEYGARTLRPHYHVLLFGLDFSDKCYWKMARGGRDRLYTSSVLENLWGKGFAPIGSVTFESAAYVARYILKKVPKRQNSYVHTTSEDSENHDYGIGKAFKRSVVFSDLSASKRKSEYVTMSRRPGIAYDWLKKYSSDVYPSDFVVMNGKKFRPPRYYDTLFKALSPDVYDDVKLLREDAFMQYELDHPGEFSIDRLAVKEKVARSRMSQFSRDAV